MRQLITNLYALLVTLAVAGGSLIILTLYKSGSEAVPWWKTAFVPGPLSAKHAFLGDKCETCHSRVKGIQAGACIGCHAADAVQLAKQPTAFHARIQDCRGCHTEHEGAARPIKMDHAALVRIGSHLASGAAAHPGILDQMVIDMAAFLGIRPPLDSEKQSLQCASCHSNSDPHRGLFGGGCAGCHETATWRVVGFLHPSPTSRDCAQCHQAPPSHYMMHFEMVSKTVAGREHAKVNECQICHQTNSFNDIKGVGWYKHH